MRRKANQLRSGITNIQLIVVNFISGCFIFK